MLALAKSPLQQHYRELMEDAFYTDDGGYYEATSYGEYLYSLTGAPLLAEICPYVDTTVLPTQRGRHLALADRQRPDTAATARTANPILNRKETEHDSLPIHHPVPRTEATENLPEQQSNFRLPSRA